MVKRYLVETVSIFRHRYVVEETDSSHAADIVAMEQAEEFSQYHVGENITSVREVSDDEIISLFYEDHPYLEGLIVPEDRPFHNVYKFKS